MSYLAIPFVLLLLSSCATHRGNAEALKNYRPSILGPQMDMDALRAHHFERMR